MSQQSPNTRAIASDIIQRILAGKTTLLTLDATWKHHQLSDENQAFCQALCYGTMRHYYNLATELDLQLNKKPKPRVYALLLVGLFQLRYMHQPAYAVVHATVSACKAIHATWAKKFVNGVLRHFARTPSQPIAYEQMVPAWFLNALQSNYPDHWQKIIDAQQKHPPYFLRLNPNQEKSIKTTLTKQGIDYQTTDLPTAIALKTPCPVDQLPGFSKGDVFIQDLSAQYAALALNPSNHMRILDACCAPGSKSCHLIDLAPKADYVLIDQSQTRLHQVQQNLTRLGQLKTNCHVISADATQPLPMNETFDKILLDAPCSATGVIRRQPDILIHRQKHHVAHIAQLQRQLLNNLWHYLKPGGQLLYATCSILPEENQKQISWFLQTHEDAILSPIEQLQPWGNDHGYQILPHPDGGDGFFYSLLTKKA